MADLSKLRRRNTLGAPPPLEEASQNLQTPEIAPVMEPPAEVPRRATVPSQEPASTPEDATPQPPHQQLRIDGRSLRKTGRTLQLATRVSWEFDEKLRYIAQRDGLKLVEVLEQALEAYEEARK
jgi:hypothetical protein